MNRGSIHSHSAGEDLNQNRDLPLVLREDFAKICFETLLQYSLLDQSDPLLTNGNIEHVTNGVAHLAMDKDAKITNKLAVTSLLHRFKEVVTSYIADEELHGSVPLPSHRVSEMSFVLKALATLISSLKRSSAGVDKRTWGLVIALYPDLVRATVTKAEAVATSLQQVKLPSIRLNSLVVVDNDVFRHCNNMQNSSNPLLPRKPLASARLRQEYRQHLCKACDQPWKP